MTEKKIDSFMEITVKSLERLKKTSCHKINFGFDTDDM